MSSKKVKKDLLRRSPKILKLRQVELKDIQINETYLLVWRRRLVGQKSRDSRSIEIFSRFDRNNIVFMKGRRSPSLNFTNIKDLEDRFKGNKKDKRWNMAIYELR